MRIKKPLLQNIKINFLTSGDNAIWEECNSKLEEQNVERNFFVIPHGDYIKKLNIGLEHTDTYFLKLDEDIFIPHLVWEFILQNLSILDDSKNAFLAPLLSTGIPTVDMFIDSFCDEDEKNSIPFMIKPQEKTKIKEEELPTKTKSKKDLKKNEEEFCNDKNNEIK